VRLDPATNIAIMRSAPAFGRFHTFCAAIEANEGQAGATLQGATVSDDEGSDDDDDDASRSERPTTRYHPDLPSEAFLPTPTLLEQQTVHTIPTEDVEVQAATPQAELLAWHYRLGHLPFAKIKNMAERGDLPAGLASCKAPRCAACLFGKATRRAWRSKAPLNQRTVPPVTAPGSVVAVDQMISATPGLIAQMRGFITHKRYNVTTVFVDHFSGLSFVFFQQSTGAFETVEAKRAFERYAKTTA
jgi:hypothetical protein